MRIVTPHFVKKYLDHPNIMFRSAFENIEWLKSVVGGGDSDRTLCVFIYAYYYSVDYKFKISKGLYKCLPFLATIIILVSSPLFENI